MEISSKCIDLITQFECFKSSPYLDQGGVPTIGYGTTRYPNGTRVTLDDAPISKEQAEEILNKVVSNTADKVDTLIVVDVNQNQFDACVSFAYNVGIGNFSSSTLLKKLNINPCDESIRDEFLKWDHIGTKEVEGLLNRRQTEADLYFT